MAIYLTSDIHWFHKGIIQHAKRPFASIEEMHEVIIANWNRVVTPNDDVYYVGDFSFGTDAQTRELRKRLNGRIHLILGNHDKKIDKIKDLFVWVKDVYMLKVHDPDALDGKTQRIFLSHYAHRVWDRSHHGVWHCYGHSHGNLAQDWNSNSTDVGTDCWNFTPVSYQQLKEFFSKIVHISVDHHGNRAFERPTYRLVTRNGSYTSNSLFKLAWELISHRFSHLIKGEGWKD